MPFVGEFAEFDFEFLFEEVAGEVGGAAEDVRDAEELGFAIGDDAGVGGDGEFAVAEGVEGVAGLVGVSAGGEVDEDVGVCGGVVLDFLDFDFSFFASGDDGVHEAAGGGAEGDFGDAEDAFFGGVDAGADADFSAAEAIAVVGGIHDAGGGEVREEGEGLVAEDGDGGVDEFVEVVREDFAGESDGDALDALGEEDRELHGEGDGFLVSSVVAGEPLGGLGVEDDVEGVYGEAGLDVAWCGCAVAGEGVSPVSLGVDEEFLLTDLDHGIADRLIAVRVVFHGVADDVGDFAVAAIVEFIHGVEDAALDGFEAVVEVGDGAFEDDVARVVEEVVGIHRAERGVLVRVVGLAGCFLGRGGGVNVLGVGNEGRGWIRACGWFGMGV